MDTQPYGVVYHIHKNSLLEFASGRTAVSLASEGLQLDNITYTAANNRAARGYKLVEEWPLVDTAIQEKPGLVYRHGALTDALGQRWYLPSDDAVLPARLPKIDFWLLNPQHSYFAVSNLLEPLKTSEMPTLIVDGRFPYYRMRAWQQLRDSTQLPIHITAIDGALELIAPPQSSAQMAKN
ncbi:MAG: hypothetical protein AAFQ37_13025 [Bacteroidota bacterium]